MNSTRQRIQAHRRRKANIAAKRPVVETWQERRDRARAERELRRPLLHARAAFGALTASDIGLLDTLFGGPDLRRSPATTFVIRFERDD